MHLIGDGFLKNIVHGRNRKTVKIHPNMCILIYFSNIYFPLYEGWSNEECIDEVKLFKGNIGRRNTLPTSAIGWKQTIGGNVKMHLKSSKTMSEAIVVLKNQLQ